MRIAATVASARGMLDRSADLFEWLGTERIGPDAHIAALVLLAAGRPDVAERMRSRAGEPAPTSSATAARLFEAGLRESVGGDGRIAMNHLTRAATAQGTSSDLWPDSIHAVTALLCMHAGELTHARDVLARRPEPVRHRLLTAWSLMLAGHLDEVTAVVDATDVEQERDRLFLHALRVGVARRRGDIGALTVAWSQARPVVDAYSADLFGLLPLGELWIAASRLRVDDDVTHLVADAERLLRALGDPPLWSASFHWYGVQAAITADRPAALVPHARALAVAAESTAYAAVLARAGAVWLHLLRRDDVDADRVRRAAEDLAAAGLSWDGARLAGEAALRATDTSDATTLLQVARSVRQDGPASALAGTAGDGPANEPANVLSEREAQVADLVVSGLTYREVGAHLYISAKTVEHHVARIRRRLGAGSRSELLSMLRALGHG